MLKVNMIKIINVVRCYFGASVKQDYQQTCVNKSASFLLPSSLWKGYSDNLFKSNCNPLKIVGILSLTRRNIQNFDNEHVLISSKIIQALKYFVNTTSN